MEKIANRIAEDIAVRFGYDGEKAAVISYGLAAIFQMVIIFAMTFVIGLIGGFYLECIIIFFAGGLLRKSTGGAHSNSFIGCLIISILMISLLAFLARYLFGGNEPYLFLLLYTLAYIVAFFVIYKRAPVDSPHKPIVREEKIRRLRRNSFITAATYYVLTVLLAYFSALNYRYMCFATSITFATLWQVFMLTAPGDKFIRTIDRKFGSE